MPGKSAALKIPTRGATFAVQHVPALLPVTGLANSKVTRMPPLSRQYQRAPSRPGIQRFPGDSLDDLVGKSQCLKGGIYQSHY